MQKKGLINETLNEILLKVISGIDYVSQIAKETNKSIPVVYRQLESLIGLDILFKARSGKKVTYDINWKKLSELISSRLFEDYKIFSRSKTDNLEINNLVKKIPNSFFDDQKEFKKIVYEFFTDNEISNMLGEFLVDLKEAGKDFIEYNKVAFDKSIDMFLEIFAIMPEERLKKIRKDKNKSFLDFLKLRSLQKKLVDPMNKFIS